MFFKYYYFFFTFFTFFTDPQNTGVHIFVSNYNIIIYSGICTWVSYPKENLINRAF